MRPFPTPAPASIRIMLPTTYLWIVAEVQLEEWRAMVGAEQTVTDLDYLEVLDIVERVATQRLVRHARLGPSLNDIHFDAVVFPIVD